ncbi:MAG: 50S ribosomal protein L18e [Candidatus Geothermarchaeales archaeon]
MKSKNVKLLHLNKTLRRVAKANASPIWDEVRERLMTPKRRRIAVNISRIDRYTEEGDTVVVPGKVLSAGTLNHRVVVAAYDFSSKALEKILNSGGQAISIEELMKKNPRGSGLKLIT